MRSCMSVGQGEEVFLILGNRCAVEREGCFEIRTELTVGMRCNERHQVWLLSKLDHVEEGKGIGEVARYLYARSAVRGQCARDI